MTITGSSPSKALETATRPERRVRHTEAAVLFKPGEVRVITVSIPELKPGQVLVEVAIEASGQRNAMETAFKALRDQRGVCILAGNLPHGEKITLDPFGFIRGKQIRGTWGGDMIPDRDFLAYAELYLSGQLKLEELCQRRYRLENINEAIQDAEQGKGIRILMEMRERE